MNKTDPELLKKMTEQLMEFVSDTQGFQILSIRKDGTIALRQWGLDKYRQAYLGQCFQAYLTSSLDFGPAEGEANG